MILPLVFLLSYALAASAQGPDLCLDNAGRFTVSTGATYSDATGTWICDPANSNATTGGWVRVVASQGSEPGDRPESGPPSPRSELAGDGRGFVPYVPAPGWIAAGAAAVAAVCLSVAALWRVSQRPRLTGWIEVEDRQDG
jgi:hypothetical protein